MGTPIGAFPSGGCARIILISGTAVVLLVHYGRLSRRPTLWLLGIPLVLGLAEAYFRTRLNQHWFTDVVAGVLYGWLMLAALWATLRAFDPDPGRVRRREASGRRPRPRRPRPRRPGHRSRRAVVTLLAARR